jgi:glycosyltransferase involved in cell wall biosynthesis
MGEFMALRPTVSVIVPCYNYGEFLADCVQSVISQAGVNTEVLIIDDASTDRSRLVAAELAARHPNVEARVHPENLGHIATYNEGIQWATGDYLVLLSADDLLVDGALDRAVSVMERHRNLGLTHGRARGFSGPPPTELSEPGNPKVEIVSGRLWFERVCQDGENPIAAPEAVVRTSVHHQVGGYDARLPHSADLELWLRIAVHSDVARIHGSHALKRSHGGSMQAVRFFDPVPRLKQREDAFLIALEHYKAHFGDHERLLAKARNGLARDALWSIVSIVRRRTATGPRTRELLSYAWSMRPRTGSWLWFVRVFFRGAGRWSRGWLKARRRAKQEQRRLTEQSA